MVIDGVFDSAARDVSLKIIIPALNVIQAAAKELTAQRRWWASKEWLLANAKWSESPSSDAQIRLAKTEQLKAMRPDLLALTAAHARETGDLATFGLALAVRSARGSDGLEDADAAVFSLADFEIPDQAVCLATIGKAESDCRHAEQLFSECMGVRQNPAARLTVARSVVEAERAIDAADRAEQDAA